MPYSQIVYAWDNTPPPTAPKAATLAEFFGVDKVNFRQADRSQFAHLIIDPQRYYSDPSLKPFTRGTRHTKQRAEKLGKVTPLFRAAGIQTAISYYAEILSDHYDEVQGGLFKVEARPDLGDIIVAKNASSAFYDRHMHEALQARGITNLFVSGFNACACVHETVVLAPKDTYRIAVLEDCIGQDRHYEADIPEYIEKMRDSGAFITNSKDALTFLNEL